MKRLILGVSFLWFSALSFAMAQEFKIYPNQLIYSPEAMKELNYVVDSLNLKFKKCEFNKRYIASLTGKCRYLFLETTDTNLKNTLKKDLENQVGYESFVKKYGNILKRNEMRELNNVVCYPQNNQSKSPYVVYLSVDDSAFSASIWSYSNYVPASNTKTYYFDVEKKYSVLYDSNTDNDTTKYLVRIAIITNLTPVYLPDKYTFLVNYADCMIDTNSKIFEQTEEFKNIKYDSIKFQHSYDAFKQIVCKNNLKKVERFNKYISKLSKDTNKLKQLDSSLKKDTQALSLLRKAYMSRPTNKPLWYDTILPFLAYRYLNLKRLNLDQLRSSRWRQTCGGDPRQYIQLQKIAFLSAETRQLGIFLRAHLDLMNDNVPRGAVGYSFDLGRGTYMKELEATGINVLDLIFGISIKVSNPAYNHYFGSINRLGCALAKSKDSLEFERRVIEMVTDTTLDAHNRKNFCYLYTNYLVNLPAGRKPLQKWEQFIQTAGVPASFIAKEKDNVAKIIKK